MAWWSGARGYLVAALAVLALLAGHSLGHSAAHASLPSDAAGAYSSLDHHPARHDAPAPDGGDRASTPVHVAAVVAAECGFALAICAATASRRTRRVRRFVRPAVRVVELFGAPEPPIPRSLLSV